MRADRRSAFMGRAGNGSNSSITTGRFTKDVGSRRLMARNDYRNTINAFTGASFDWQGANKDQMTVFWTMPHNRLPNDVPGILDNAIVMDEENLDLQFYGSSYTFANVFGGTLELYGYGLYEDDTGSGLRSLQTRNRRLFTPGFRLWKAPRPAQWDWEVETTYQTGRARETAAITDRRDLHVSAYFFHTQAGYTFNTAWLPRVSFQYDQASGDSANPATFVSRLSLAILDARGLHLSDSRDPCVRPESDLLAWYRYVMLPPRDD